MLRKVRLAFNLFLESGGFFLIAREELNAWVKGKDVKSEFRSGKCFRTNKGLLRCSTVRFQFGSI